MGNSNNIVGRPCKSLILPFGSVYTRNKKMSVKGTFKGD